MKAVVFTKPGEMKIKDIDIPTISSDEVLLRNKYAGFCGTDLHIFNGDFISEYPLIPGHEFSGIVEKVGENVDNFNIGDEVVVSPNICCNSCYYCNINQQNFCDNFGGYGVTINGGFAQYSKILASNLIKIENIEMKEAAMIEPLACVIYGLNKIKTNYGEKALIFGAGPIGLLILQLLNMNKLSNITVVEIDEKKRAMCKLFGAENFFVNDDKLTKNLKEVSEKGFDIIVDATGLYKVCDQTFQYANNNARILLYGVCGMSSKINVSPFLIYRKDLSVYGAFSYNRTMSAAIELVKNKKIRLNELISHEYALKDFEKAFKTASGSNFSKILIDCC